MKPTIQQIKEVRQRTGLGLMEVKAAFESVDSFEEIFEVLSKRGVEILTAKRNRNAGVRRLRTYCHHNGKYASIVEFACETDFVAKSERFVRFMDDICIHVAVADLDSYPQPLNESFFQAPFVKDDTKTIGDLLGEVSAATGEKVEIPYICQKQIESGTKEQHICARA